MAILFDWYENPQSSEQQGEENALHPRLRLNGKMSTAQLRARIQKRCTLTETDVIAVLDALSHAMGEELADGKQVHLDGIGFFRPNLVSTEPVTEKTKYKNTKVKLKGIVYRPDQAAEEFPTSLWFDTNHGQPPFTSLVRGGKVGKCGTSQTTGL